MTCECCGNSPEQERFGFFHVPTTAEVVTVANHRRHVLCARCMNEASSALEATTWWLAEWAEWRALETNSTRDRGREAVAGDFLRLHAQRAKVYAYFMAAVDGRRKSLRDTKGLAAEGDLTETLDKIRAALEKP